MASLFSAEAILQEFEAGDLEPPGLLSWKRWQSWRADFGRRPAIRRGDAAGTSTKEESEIWKGVMAGFHGPEWRAELRAQNNDADLAGSSDLLGEGASQFSSGESAEQPLEGGQRGADLRDGVPQEGISRDDAPAATTGPEG